MQDAVSAIDPRNIKDETWIPIQVTQPYAPIGIAVTVHLSMSVIAEVPA